MMRRPPDNAKPLTVSEGDVDSSNATLNTLFGGARQKSWMTTTGAPVRPSPRRVSKSLLPAISAQGTTTVLPSPSPSPAPAPSAEPSPLLVQSNILQQSSGNNDPATDPTRGSNTIDLTPARLASTQSPEPQSEGRFSPSSLVTLPPQASVDHHLPPLQAQRLPPPNDANVSHAPVVPPQHGHRPTPQAVQSPITISNAASPLQAQYQNPSRWSGSPNGSVQPTNTPNSGQAQIRGHESRDQHPSPALVSSDSPNTMSENSHYSPTEVQGHAQSQPSAERVPFPSSLVQTQILPHPSRETAIPLDVPRPTRPPIMTLLKPKIPMIQAHINSAGGSQNLNTLLERPRFRLLTDACDMQDIFYVVLHQVFCVWDYDRSLISNIGGLPTRDTLASAFSILGQLIRHNEGMATNHLEFFASFPTPINSPWETSEPFRQVLGDVGAFLYKLATQWVLFSKQCLHRQYPPLVDELVNGLGIISPILQGVVFTATRRNLGLPDDQFGQRAETIFTQDRAGYQEISTARNNELHSPSAMLMRNQQLVGSYFALRAASQVADTSLSRPSMAANNVRSEAVHFSPSIAMGQATRIPIQQSQVPRNNQRTQPMTVTTSRSSAPSSVVIGGRTPTAASQLSQATAVNSTSFQGPTIVPPSMASPMHSPMSRSPAMPSQGQQGMAPSHPIVPSNGYPVEQDRNHQIHLSTFQGTTTSSASRHGEPMDHRRLSLADLQRQQMFAMQQYTQQALAARQGQRQRAVTPNTQPRQPQISSQMQSSMMAQGGPPQHQASSLNRPPQLSRTSFQPTSQQHVNRGRTSNGSLGVPDLEPQTSAVPNSPRPTAMQNQVHAYHNIHPPIMRPLVPPLGHIHSAGTPNPTLTALHQAHVRSPVLLRAPQPCGRETPPGNASRRFYQSVKGFALQPSKIPAIASISNFEFTINEQDLSLRAKDTTRNATSQVPARQFSQGTLQYRLRCVRAKQSTCACSIPEWIVNDTVWPETIFIRVNGQFMEIRRKAHHLKDLPIDITSYILPAVPNQGSTNEIKVSTPHSSKHDDQSTYFMAVEVVEILDHSQIMDLCNQQRIPASQTLDAIKKSLAGPTNSDDDISMVVSDLSISLADPFTARIFDIPVRGDFCLHRECFDLEPFLLTRKAKGVNQPCMVDVWKCPLCGGDARPYTLRVDDFFTTIRAKLAKDESLGTKAIWVSADGSWKPKYEAPLKRKDSPGFYSDDEEEGLAAKQRILDGAMSSRTVSMEAVQRRRSANRAMEIIELDDD